MTRKKPKPVPLPDPFPIVVETFARPDYDLRRLDNWTDPSCFNGIVNVERYRVTADRIVEPVEVIHERLRKMWRECTNYHHYDPLRKTAKRFGLELDSNELGIDRARQEKATP